MCVSHPLLFLTLLCLDGSLGVRTTLYAVELSTKKYTSFLLWLIDVSLWRPPCWGSHAGHTTYLFILLLMNIIPSVPAVIDAPEHLPSSSRSLCPSCHTWADVCSLHPGGNWGLGRWRGGGAVPPPRSTQLSAQRPVPSCSEDSLANITVTILVSHWGRGCEIRSHCPSLHSFWFFSNPYFSRHFPMIKDSKKDKNVLNLVPWKDNASLVKNDKRWYCHW